MSQLTLDGEPANRMRQLRDLISALPGARQTESSITIREIVTDSRQARPGSLFVAVAGVSVDGHRFIPDAIQRGAIAIVGERSRATLDLPDGTPYIQVESSRLALAHLAAAFHGNPARRMHMIGVTGTDGKTTTTNLIYQILRAAGKRVSMISTVNARIGQSARETGLHTTTPDALDTQRYLTEMVADGSQVAVLEATSHGLAQHRVSACEFDTAVVTNVTHEHLDFHGTREAYRVAKAMLFKGLSHADRKPGIPKVSVLNRDDDSFEWLVPIPADMKLTYGLHAGSDLTATDIVCTDRDLRFVAHTPAGRIPIHSRLAGEYNVYNILAAAAVAVAMDIPGEQIQAGVGALQGIIGRGERIELGQPFTVIVDFAHTPNALRNILLATRKIARGKITVVFGCAGLRDIEKRALMGQVAAELADCTILTAEDPRTEDIRQINAQIIEGYRRTGRLDATSLIEIDDRAQAIQHAIDAACPNDLVLITGKGHEQSLCFGTVETPWSDHAAVIHALQHRTPTGSYR